MVPLYQNLNKYGLKDVAQAEVHSLIYLIHVYIITTLYIHGILLHPKKHYGNWHWEGTAVLILSEGGHRVRP